MKNTKLYYLLFEAVEDNKQQPSTDVKSVAVYVRNEMSDNKNAFIESSSINDTGEIISFGYSVKMKDSGWEGSVSFEINKANLVAHSIKSGAKIKESTKDFIPDGSKGKVENLKELKKFIIHEINSLIQLGMFAAYM